MKYLIQKVINIVESWRETSQQYSAAGMSLPSTPSEHCSYAVNTSNISNQLAVHIYTIQPSLQNLSYHLFWQLLTVMCYYYDKYHKSIHSVQESIIGSIQSSNYQYQ